MINIVIVVLIVLTISFVCSLLESIILSITRPYIQVMIDKKHRAGKILQKLKNKIDEPLAAILTMNTIANTAGSAIAGAIALRVIGSEWIAAFSAFLTFGILIFSEIIPKTIGASYWKNLGPFSAYMLKGMIFVLKPIIIPINLISKSITRNNPSSKISKAEILNFIKIGYFQGVIQSSEMEIAENLFRMRTIKVKEIMTPRTVVFWIPPDLTIDELLKTSIMQLPFSRIPIYNPDENTIEGIVLRRNIMNYIALKKTKIKVKTISKKPDFVLESIDAYKLMHKFIVSKSHIAVVLNEYGDYTGIVTLEDAIETLIGKEIVDEFDNVIDMRDLAEKEKNKLFKKKVKKK